MNKKKYWSCVVLVVFAISFASVVFAEEADKPTCNLDLTFYSKYVWRGFELSKDSLVIFPSITVGYKGFDFNVWGDFDTDYELQDQDADGVDDENNNTRWWETDWVLTYSNSIDLGGTALNWTLGWIYYDTDPLHVVDEDGDIVLAVPGDNEEVFVVLGLDTILSPEISVWRGIEYGESWYIHFALSHSFELQNGHSIDVGGWVAYLDIDDADYNEWHDGTIWVGYNIPVNDWCTISPSVNYSFPLSNESEDVIEAASFDGKDSDWFYGGVNVNISF